MPLPSQNSSSVIWPLLIKGGLVVLFIVSVLGSVLVWALPVEVAQNWAIQRAEDNPYAQYEAAGQMEAAWFLAKWGFPVLIALAVWGMRRCRQLEDLLRAVGRELGASLVPPGAVSSKAKRLWWGRGIVVGGLLLGWLVLGAIHAGYGAWQRARDWPYYRFKSGAEILPNISDANRDVIRYVRQATPESARILVLSDQKLFFLSYYLLPRRLYHPVHADSEFVIPLPNQQRQLAAYRLADLTPEQIDRWNPDYILEYFEGEQFVDPARRGEDADWVRFWQQRNRSAELPGYVVSLKKRTAGGRP